LPSVRVIGTAAGCLSALQMVKDRQADLVVVDSNLPLSDVRVMLQHLRQDGIDTQSLVLVATSSEVRHAMAAGANAALRRDVSSDQLNQVVAELKRARSGDGPRLGQSDGRRGTDG
jgi:DNA-binding NarL/FixJ family response regulator